MNVVEESVKVEEVEEEADSFQPRLCVHVTPPPCGWEDADWLLSSS